jgi:DNA-binding CsgD family transcriptional regulator
VERLLERDMDLEALAGAVEQARRGRGSFVLVGGEAGSGKSSLVRAVRAGLDEQVAFLSAGCEFLAVPVPLAAVRELAAAAGDRTLVERQGEDRFALAVALLDAIRSRAPAVVVVVEDLHWADPATLDVIRLLARRVGDAEIAIVLTYRDDEIGANPVLELLVGDLATDPNARRLHLRPLSESAIRELAEPSGLDAEELAGLTSGNPFLVVEAVAAGGVMPASVREATLARVGRLGPEARGVVDAAAVIGQRVPPHLLARVAPGSVAATEEAIARGVLLSEGETIAFRHELTRRAIEDSISAPRAAALHQRVLTALAESGEADPARLADHAERAGLTAEAGRYAELAAADAERVGALSEASLQLARALRSAPRLDPAKRLELLLRYVLAENFAGGLNEARLAAEEAVRLGEHELGPAAHGRALTGLAWSLWSLDRVTEAKEAARQAVEVLAPTGETGYLARAWGAALRIEAIAFEPAAVVAAAPAALELAARAGLDDLRIDLTISLALARGHQGDPAAKEQLAEMLGAARAARLPFQTIRAYVNAIDVAAELRDHAAVDALAGAALERLDGFQTAIPRESVLVSVARSLLDRGRYAEALDHAGRGRRTAHGNVPLSLAIEAVVRARRGEPGVDDLLRQAWEAIAAIPEGWRHGQVRVALAEAAWLRGDLEAALAHIRDGLAAPYANQLARSSSELALWALRCGVRMEPLPPGAPEALRLELAGDVRGARQEWQRLEAPYEHALAALAGTDRDARESMAALQRLGADAAARALSRERGRRGLRAPRGARRSTLANAAGLTRREQDVLAELARGSTNHEIAQTLHLSERTVAHHVSAILAKLGAPSRMTAVDTARRAGLVPQDGPSPGQT